MRNLFEAVAVEEVKARMAQLRPDSERQWGKMNPSQALAHCSAAMGMAMGTICPPRILIGRLLGPLAKKSMIVNGKPMRRNSMTDKSVVVTDERGTVVIRELVKQTDKEVVLREYLPKRREFSVENPASVHVVVGVVEA